MSKVVRNIGLVSLGTVCALGVRKFLMSKYSPIEFEVAEDKKTQNKKPRNFSVEIAEFIVRNKDNLEQIANKSIPRVYEYICGNPKYYKYVVTINGLKHIKKDLVEQCRK